MDDGSNDELGAHVSIAGGVDNAPSAAAEIGSVCLQCFTKQPNRWHEPRLDEATVERFEAERRAHGIEVAGAHDSYLINLASPDRTLRGRSIASFEAELRRCVALGLDFLVTHPGHATDGDAEEGVRRNARALGRALEEVDGPTRVLLELTAGGGSSVGGSFELLAAILDEVPAAVRDRVGVCIDTCHAYAAGYDLVADYEGVWRSFERILGWDRLGLLHMNDSRHPLGSRKDRHETLGQGTLGPEPFRKIMRDERLRGVPKILETPKGDDPVASDRANLVFLRGFRER
jgi:deoxyribonuclease-4